MSTILFAWELGGGLGHLVQLRPIAHSLLHRGHRVGAVLRDLSRARRVFGDAVTLLQAPVKTRPPDTPISPPFTFSHILHNLGYEHEDELIALASAWRNLFTTYKPDGDRDLAYGGSYYDIAYRGPEDYVGSDVEVVYDYPIP